MKKRIVITGMGVVSCYGTNVNTFYEKLLQGVSGISEVTGVDLTDIPTKFGGQVRGFDPELFIDKKQARRVDPCIAFAVAAGKMAMQHAKLEVKDPTRAGVLIGSGMGGMHTYNANVEAMVKAGPKRVSPFFIPYVITNMGGAILAMELGFKGPNYSVSTACATSNYSIYLAAEHIRRGDADVMIAGGAEASVNTAAYAGFSALKAISRRNEEMIRASRPWDKGRDGFVIGEGCGVIVLESLEHALARGATILAEYVGGALTCDAHHMTEPTPDGSDVARCMRLALQDAELNPEDVDYINAHATSTPVGDLCEVRAIKTVFGPHVANVRINATKSLIGHALGAAGALEMIAVVKALTTGVVHPTLNFEDPEEEVKDLSIVHGKPETCHPNVAMSNSFGFGGHNSTVVVKRWM